MIKKKKNLILLFVINPFELLIILKILFRNSIL